MTDREFLNEMWLGWSNEAAFEFLTGFTLVVVRWAYRDAQAHWETSTTESGVEDVVVRWGSNLAIRLWAKDFICGYTPKFWSQSNVEYLIDRNFRVAHPARPEIYQ